MPGRVTATVDGRRFESTPVLGDILAHYDTIIGYLQITGQVVQPGRWPTLHLLFRCDQLPRPGSYQLGNLSDPVHAELFLPQGRRGIRSYTSDSTMPGTVVLETVDTARRLIRGHFAFSSERPNHAGPGPVVRGFFEGRIRLHGEHGRAWRGWWSGLKHGC